jgi:hypothetical protein
MHTRSICREELFMGSELNATDSSMRAAFFDVDDTLLSEKSMSVFLRYWIKQRDGDDSAYQKIESEIRAKVESGVHRTEINRMYYRLFAGVPLAELLAAGRDWYRTYREADRVRGCHAVCGCHAPGLRGHHCSDFRFFSGLSRTARDGDLRQ